LPVNTQRTTGSWALRGLVGGGTHPGPPLQKNTLWAPTRVTTVWGLWCSQFRMEGRWWWRLTTALLTAKGNYCMTKN